MKLILKNMEIINGKLSEQYFNYHEANLITKANAFQFALEDVLKENALIYERITKRIRQKFN